jgi:hypothetical protein
MPSRALRFSLNPVQHETAQLRERNTEVAEHQFPGLAGITFNKSIAVSTLRHGMPNSPA